MDSNNEPVLWAAKSSNTKALGSAIARELVKTNTLTVRGIGVAAVNQCVKAIAVAGGFLGQRGNAVNVRIGFVEVTVPNKEQPITAMNFRLVLI